MAKILQYTIGGGVLFAGVVYGRMYLDVLSAESTVHSITREMQKTTNEIENIKEEVVKSRKSLEELDIKGAQKLKEQSEIQNRVQQTTSLLTKLKTELASSKADFEQVQSKIKETNDRLERLQSATGGKQRTIQEAQKRMELAMLESQKARVAMLPKNLPLLGPLFKE